jgi:uncharacterized membrane protein
MSTAEPSYAYQVSDDEQQWAPLAYVGLFVLGFLAPLFVVATRRQSHFCRFHATQAINLWIAVFACDLVAVLLIYLTGFTAVLVLLAVMTAGTVAAYKAAIETNRGDWYRLPPFVAWPLIKVQP